MASKPKGPSAQQQRNERLQEELMRKQLAASNQPLELPSMAAPPPAPPPPPPPSGTSADVLEAGTDAKRKAFQRTNASRGTLFTGESGGYKATASGNTGGQKTLLGGA